MVRCYETVFVLRPTLNDQEITDTIESYRNLLIREGAEILREEDLGKKKLAYTIKHFQNGHYGIFLYNAQPAAVAELERTFKISEDLLRFLTVRTEAVVPEEPAVPAETPAVPAETPAAPAETPAAPAETPAAPAETPAAPAETPAAPAETPAESEEV